MDKIRIGIGDGNQVFLNEISEYLSRMPDIELVGTCSSGADVLPMVKRTNPDVLVLEIALKCVDGISLLKTLKTSLSNISVIICSEFFNSVCLRLARRYGADFYMCKPVSREALYDAIVGCVTASGSALTESETHPDKDLDAAASFLTDIGVPQNSAGFRYLCDAATLVRERPVLASSLTKLLYPELARLNSATPAGVERSIRSAVRHACGSTDFLIEGHRPTNREMIALLAKIAQ